MPKINRKSPSEQNSTWGLPIGRNMRFSEYGHIIYRAVANFMQSLKNIRTMCSKLTENPHQSSIALWILARG